MREVGNKNQDLRLQQQKNASIRSRLDILQWLWENCDILEFRYSYNMQHEHFVTANWPPQLHIRDKECYTTFLLGCNKN